VLPAQGGIVSSRVASTKWYVHLHPADAPDRLTMQTLRDQWHANGIRMEYNGPSPFYDQVLANAYSVGLSVIFITGGTLPTAAGNGAYALAAGVSAKRYAGYGLTWEIANEPDLFYGQGGVAKYIALAKATALAIRANDATATILTGGTSGKDRDFVFEIAAGKALAPYVDGVAIHPYGIDYNSMGSATVIVSLATGMPVSITEWASADGQGIGQAMASAKGLASAFCVYEYQDQSGEIAVHDPAYGLLDSGAWAAFAAVAN